MEEGDAFQRCADAFEFPKQYGNDNTTENSLWKIVKEVADLAFSIWVDHPSELKWAKRSWNLIVRAGFANFSNEIERCRDPIRII